MGLMMNWKNLAKVTLMSTSLIFTGCGDDDGGGDTDMMVAPDTPAGEDMMVMTGPLPGECADGECFFVASEVDAPEEFADGTRAGANLDGEVSTLGGETGCGQADFTNRFGEDGVDNQLSALINTIAGAAMLDISQTLRDNVNDGTIVILMGLSGAESTNDDSVSGQFFVGELAGGGGAPMLAGDPPAIAAGQTFDTTSDAITITGRTENGVLRGQIAELTSPLPLGEGEPLPLTVANVGLRADITASGLERGEITGSLSVPFLVDVLGGGGACTMDSDCASGGGCQADMTCGANPLLPDGVPAATIEQILRQQADLDPNAEGDCESISLAITFTGVPATQGAAVTE